MNIPRLRKGAQVLTIILIILVPLLNKKGITMLSGSLYSFAVGPLWITDPLIGFQTILTTMTADITLLLSMVLPVALALAFGRVFCGWVCPQNTISELVDLAAAKFRITRPFGKSTALFPRYAILAVILLATLLLKLPLASLLSAPGIISVQTAKLIYEGLVGLELGLIAMIIFIEFFLIRRGWCNYVCPVGSFLGIFRFAKTMKVTFAEDRERVCGQCLACSEACQLGLNPMKDGLYPQCHNCGACIAACDNMKGEKRPLNFTF